MMIDLDVDTVGFDYDAYSNSTHVAIPDEEPKFHEAIFSPKTQIPFTKRATQLQMEEDLKAGNLFIEAMSKPTDGSIEGKIEGRWGGKDGFEWSGEFRGDVHDKDGNGIGGTFNRDFDGSIGGGLRGNFSKEDNPEKEDR